MNHHQEDHDQQMNSSEEVDQPEELEYDPNDHVGTGRSYECMFCKRGFTTAQALGGHMNIHRKDRAKNRPNNSSAKQINDQESNYFASGPRIYHPIFSSYPPQYLTAQEEAVQFHYRTYFPSTSGATRLSYDQNINHNTMISHSHDQFSHRIISPCGEDLRMGLSLQYGNSSYGEDMDHQKKSTSWIGNREEDGLDLELRLGHDP